MRKFLLLFLLMSGVAHAQTVNIPDPAFKAALIALGYDTDNDGNIEVPEVQSITNLDLSFRNIGDLTGISSFTSLVRLNCDGAVSPTATLTSIDVSMIATLQEIAVRDNDITSVILNAGIRIAYLNGNQLTSFDPSPYPNLVTLDLANNHLTDFTVHGNNLSLELVLNNLINVNLSGSFSYLSLANNSALTTIDLSQSTYGMLWFSDSPITMLNLKNGYNGDYNLSEGNYPDVLFVCVDDYAESQYFQSFSDNHELHWVVNPYCSFTPGGDFNTITGTIRNDSNNNGCNSDDIHNDFIKINVANDTYPGVTFSAGSGDYHFFTGAGSYTLTPQFENPDWFTASPASAVVEFPLNDSSVSVNDFCIVANGNHPDLEVVLSGNPPRPGFDTRYQLVYRNNGNTVLSGLVTATFDDLRMDFASANPAIETQDGHTLVWSFSNLTPFETRTIEFFLEVNGPTDTPAVNDGDVFNFFASGEIPNDETPADNVFTLHQTAANSYDPNNKTALEGAVVSPDNIGKYLHYNINFENIGSAEAINIVVKDIINTNMFDMSTLQIIQSSHELNVRVRDNIVEFIYKNINMPSSISNPIGGHGNVLFKIKTRPTLYAGDVVTNTANIYFDYNHPIETNEARTTFTTLKRQEFVTDNSVVIYPNPAKSKVSVNAGNNIQSIALFDVQGRILQVIPAKSSAASVDISNQSKGEYFLKITTVDGIKVEKIIKE